VPERLPGVSFGAGDFLLATGYAMLGGLRWVWIGWLAYLAASFGCGAKPRTGTDSILHDVWPPCMLQGGLYIGGAWCYAKKRLIM